MSVSPRSVKPSHHDHPASSSLNPASSSKPPSLGKRSLERHSQVSAQTGAQLLPLQAVDANAARPQRVP